MTLDYSSKQAIQDAQYASAYHWDQKKRVETYRYEKMTDLFVNLIEENLKNENIRLLDFGCGDGRSTFLIWSALRAKGFACQAIGVDISGDAINWAKQMTESVGEPSLGYIHGSLRDGVEALAEGKGRVFVVMREVIEHLPDSEIDTIFQSISSCVPDAAIIISVPSTNSPTEKKHFRHYDSNDLRYVFRRNGFRCDKIIGFGFRPALLYSTLHKLKARLNKSRYLWRATKWMWRTHPRIWAITLISIGAFDTRQKSNASVPHLQ